MFKKYSLWTSLYIIISTPRKRYLVCAPIYYILMLSIKLLNVQDGHSITLEPGGQLELSGAPFRDLHAVHDELDTHLNQVNP